MSHKAESGRADADGKVDRVGRRSACRDDEVGRERAGRQDASITWNEKNVRSINVSKQRQKLGFWRSRRFSAALRDGVRRRWGRMSRAEHEGREWQQAVFRSWGDGGVCLAGAVSVWCVKV